MTIARPPEYDDIQGLVHFGYGRLKQACFILLRVKDRKAARAWLASAQVSNAVEPPPETALQIALSCPGMRALGVEEDIVSGFSNEFIVGMSSDAARARRLGDQGANDPGEWLWGGDPEQGPHVMVMLYALSGKLEAWQRGIEAELETGFERLRRLTTAELDEFEPFGFADGISQPKVDWDRDRPVVDEERVDYSNLSCLGEYLLGYPNEYGEYTDRPLLDAARDPASILPRAENMPDKADFGRNGSYLVVRQLSQDVGQFWRFVDGLAQGDAGLRVQLAEAMVGRTIEGAPLVDTDEKAPDDKSARNGFTYLGDGEGLRCPFGAHIRRSNPRNADLPPGEPGFVSWAKRTLGFDAKALADDLVSSTRFHRLLRRGRKYGERVTLEEALAAPPTNEARRDDTGLHFICLGANIARQFEFVQGAWLAGTHFNGLSGESDPLLGNRLPDIDGRPTDAFTIPIESAPNQRVSGIPQFVTVLGGGYFFLPGIRALRYMTKVQP